MSNIFPQGRILINNLYIINSNFLTFKINNELHPVVEDEVHNVKRVNNFYVDKNSTKLIVVILSKEQIISNESETDIEVVIVSGIQGTSSYGIPDYYNYSVISSSASNLSSINGYFIVKIFITEIPKHSLRELEIEKFNQLIDLYTEYQNKGVDDNFFFNLIRPVSKCFPCFRKENKDLVLLTNKQFYSKFTKHYDNTKYSKIKVYCVVNESSSTHYSLTDSEAYQTIFTNWNTGITLQKINKNKINDLIKQVIEDKKDGFVCFVIMAADPFNNACSAGENGPNILINNLIQLHTLCTVIPDIDMLIAIGSKKYVSDKEFNDLMLPNTVTYSGDDNNEESNMIILNENDYIRRVNKDAEINKIKSLPPDYYIMKQGYSGSASEFYHWGYSNYLKKYTFYRSGNTILRSKELVQAKGEEIYNDLHEKYINRVKSIKSKTEHFTFDESDNVPCNDFFIVQKYSELYKNCHEFKFSIINDQIVCIHTSTISRINNFDKYLSELDELPPININIVNFINKVISIVKSKWKNYIYLRIDIVCECDPNNKYDVLFSQDKVNIFLNEIENLGSGLKSTCAPVHNKQINLYGYETSDYDYVYDLLVEKFMNIINNKLNIQNG